MPKYKITDPETGQSLFVTGDSPPSQEDAKFIFSSRTGTKLPAQEESAKEPGLMESIKALPRTAFEVAKSIPASLAGIPQWAVEMQEKYSGKPYEGLLTTKLPSGKTVAQASAELGQKIQAFGGGPETEAEKREIAAVNYPFKKLGEAGEAIGGATKAITGSPSAGTLAEASVNLAPLFFGSKGGKEILKGVVEKGVEKGEAIAERGYRSALKPGAKYTPEEQAAMVKTGLKEGITVGRESGWASLDSLQKKIDATTKNITDIIDKSHREGTAVKTAPVIAEIDKAQALYPPWEKSSELESMKEYLGQREEIPTQEAYKLKQQIQRSQRNNYDKLSGLANDGEKFAGHAILDQLIAENPKLKDLGLQDKAMINLRQAIDSRVKTWSKRDLISVRGLMEFGSGLVAGQVSGHPWLGTLVGIGATVMEHPAVKSALSIALNRANTMGGKISAKVIEKAVPVPPIRRPLSSFVKPRPPLSSFEQQPGENEEDKLNLETPYEAQPNRRWK